MDDIHEYLLLKGVDAVSIHGGKEQDERNEAIKLFKVCLRDPRWGCGIWDCAWCPMWRHLEGVTPPAKLVVVWHLYSRLLEISH